MSSITTHEEGFIARPVSVLVPLIKKDLAQAHEAETEAAKTAGEPYYAAAGAKMLEAKGQMPHGEFADWIKRNFNCGTRNAQLYMSLAHATSDLKMRNDVSHLSELSFRRAIREHTKNTKFGVEAPWRSEIKESVKRAKEDAIRREAENLSRQQERDADRKLALQLIDIGFKFLASKLHPDKGGSKDAMARLNRVRNNLKQHA